MFSIEFRQTLNFAFFLYAPSNISTRCFSLGLLVHLQNAFQQDYYLFTNLKNLWIIILEDLWNSNNMPLILIFNISYLLYTWSRTVGRVWLEGCCADSTVQVKPRNFLKMLSMLIRVRAVEGEIQMKMFFLFVVASFAQN